MLNHILLGFGISFIGSLPLGVLNLTAIEVAVKHRFYQVFLFSFGVILIEYFQAFAALYFSDIIMSNPKIDEWIQVGVIPLFFLIGLAYMLSGYKEQKAKKEGAQKSKVSEKEIAPIYKGIMLSIINPLAIPYWLAVSTAFKSTGQLQSGMYYTQCFIIGVVTGTFVALSLYGALGEVLEKKLAKYEVYFNSVIGLMLIGLAIWQAWRVFG